MGVVRQAQWKIRHAGKTGSAQTDAPGPDAAPGMAGKSQARE